MLNSKNGFYAYKIVFKDNSVVYDYVLDDQISDWFSGTQLLYSRYEAGCVIFPITSGSEYVQNFLKSVLYDRILKDKYQID